MLDLGIFVTAPEELMQARFAALYRWKGFSDVAIERLWTERSRDEWPAVETQRHGADLVLAAGVNSP